MDAPALASLLRDIVAEDFEGVQANAAREVGLRRELFNKLCQERKPGIDPETLAALFSLAGRGNREDRVERLQASLSTPAMRLLEEDQLEWELREWIRLRFPIEDLSAWDATSTPRRELRGGQATADQIRRFATQEGRALLERLHVERDTRALVEDFTGKLIEAAPMIGSRSHHATPDVVWQLFRYEQMPPVASLSLRAILALLRVLQPLLVSIHAPLERSWREMDARDLAAYLRAAIRAELILLRREADPQRTRSLAAEA